MPGSKFPISLIVESREGRDRLSWDGLVSIGLQNGYEMTRGRLEQGRVVMYPYQSVHGLS